MKKIRPLVIICFLGYVTTAFSQLTELQGKLIANGDVEGIHILNKTASKYAISQEDGSFVVLAKSKDTLVITGLKYETKTVVITDDIITIGRLTITLIEKINELDQVIIGKLLTGSLESDLENSDAKVPINFYDLGIPGNTNLPLTQNERKLFDADGGSWGSIGFGGSVNFHKLLNAISGRTKKLKRIVDLDNRDKCIKRLKQDYEDYIFENDSLPDNLRTEFYLFAQQDASFLWYCSASREMEAIEFLKRKLTDYYKNREEGLKD